MKAKKQERIIAITTAVLIAGSAALLFVSGMADGNDGNDNTAVEETSVASVATVEKDSDTVEIDLSGMNTYTVGSTGLGFIEESAQNTDLGESQPYKYKDTFIVNVDEYMNVRAEASTDSEIVGKIYKGGGGQVIEKGQEWSLIKSGNVEGYVKNDLVWFGRDAEEHMAEVCNMYAVSKTNALRVRDGANTDSRVISSITEGYKVTVLGFEGDWAKIIFEDEVGYIFAEYLDIECEIGKGITIEEEQEAIRLEQERKAAEAKRKAEEEAARLEKQKQAIANATLTETIQTSPYNISEEDAYLIACVVYAEAGYESYEGQLAVANIVLNRLASGRYGNSVHDILYARNQFTIVLTQKFKNICANGPGATALQATKDAVGGKNNIPGYLYYCSSWAAKYDRYSSYTIVCNQTFYNLN